MALPIAAIGAALRSGSAMTGRAAAMGLLGGVSNATSNLMNPASRSLAYRANFRMPNNFPDPEPLINAFYKGIITNEQLTYGLKHSGINLEAGGILDWNEKYWQAILESSAPWPDSETVIDAYLMGFVDPNDLDAWLKRSGIHNQRILDYTKQWTTPFPLDQAKFFLSGGLWIRQQYDDNAKRLGYRKQADIDLTLQNSSPAPPGESLVLYNRGVLDNAAMNYNLIRFGMYEAKDRADFIELAKQIPSPSDLIHFALKEAWDPNVVAEFGYDAEFPVPFQHWMQQQGYGWASSYKDAAGAVVPGPNWPLLYWRAHWATISPGQAYQMEHRLRGDPNDPATWRIPGVRPWTRTDTNRILKIHDYPVPFRDRLAALSYRVPTRVDVRRFLELNVINQSEAKEYYQDMGYTATDAAILVKYVGEQRKSQRMNRLRQGTKARIERAYQLGSISKDAAAVQLYRLLALSPTELATFDAQIPVDQINIATTDPLVNGSLLSIDADLQEKLTRKSVMAVRKVFMNNEVDRPTATSLLVKVGIQQARITQYLDSWDTQRWGTGKFITPTRILAWMRKGQITPTIAAFRLNKLGYHPDDVTAWIKETSDTMLMDQVKAEAKLRKTGTAIPALTPAQLDAMATTIESTQKALVRHGTPSQLAAWVATNSIPRIAANARLLALQWPQSDIDSLINDAIARNQ